MCCPTPTCSSAFRSQIHSSKRCRTAALVVKAATWSHKVKRAARPRTASGGLDLHLSAQQERTISLPMRRHFRSKRLALAAQRGSGNHAIRRALKDVVQRWMRRGNFKLTRTLPFLIRLDALLHGLGPTFISFTPHHHFIPHLVASPPTQLGYTYLSTRPFLHHHSISDRLPYLTTIPLAPSRSNRTSKLSISKPPCKIGLSILLSPNRKLSIHITTFLSRQ